MNIVSKVIRVIDDVFFCYKLNFLTFHSDFVIDDLALKELNMYMFVYVSVHVDK